MQPSLTLLDVRLPALVQHLAVLHLRHRLSMDFLQMVGHLLDLILLVFLLLVQLVADQAGTILDLDGVLGGFIYGGIVRLSEGRGRVV